MYFRILVFKVPKPFVLVINIYLSDANDSSPPHMHLLYIIVALLSFLFVILLSCALRRRRLYTKYVDSINDVSSSALVNSSAENEKSYRKILPNLYIANPITMLQYPTKEFDLIHCGNMAIVRKAKYLNHDVAVKTYSTPNRRQNFEDELDTLCCIRQLQCQENLLNLVGWFKTAESIENSDYYTSFSIVSKFVHGQTLRQFLNDHRLDWYSVCMISISAIDAVAFLHKDGILNVAGCCDQKHPIAHRNLGSQNFLIRDDATCVLTGFSCAVVLDDTKSCQDLGDRSLRSYKVQLKKPCDFYL